MKILIVYILRNMKLEYIFLIVYIFPLLCLSKAFNKIL